MSKTINKIKKQYLIIQVAAISAFFITLSLLFICIYTLFLQNWNITFYNNRQQCIIKRYLLDIQSVNITQIICITMNSITTLGCLFLILSLCLFYQKNSQNIDKLRYKRFHVSFIFSFLSIICNLWVLLYAIRIHNAIQQLNNDWKSQSLLKNKIQKSCFSEQTFQDITIDKVKLFAVVIVLSSLSMFLFLIVLITLIHMLCAFNNTQMSEDSQKKQLGIQSRLSLKQQYVQASENSFQRIFNNNNSQKTYINQGVGQNTIPYQEQLVDEEKYDKNLDKKEPQQQPAQKQSKKADQIANNERYNQNLTLSSHKKLSRSKIFSPIGVRNKYYFK